MNVGVKRLIFLKVFLILVKSDFELEVFKGGVP